MTFTTPEKEEQLRDASKNGDIDEVRDLLQSGTDFNAFGGFLEMAPLHLAGKFNSNDYQLGYFEFYTYGPDRLCLLLKTADCYFLLVIYGLLFWKITGCYRNTVDYLSK